MRTFAIGDIHGCYYTLLELMNKLPLESGDKIIFLGDYIDRGLHSKQVVQYVKEMADAGQAIALLGNHEKMCIDTYNGSGHWGQTWRNNGAEQTVDSYDARSPEDKIMPPMFDTERRDEWNANLPKVSNEHITWMESLPLTHEDEKYIYVHAGINPDYPMNEQVEDDLLWIRNKFLNCPTQYPKIVVFGHTALEKPIIKHNFIGLDTGCVYGNFLSAMCMESGTLFKAEHDDRDGTA